MEEILNDSKKFLCTQYRDLRNFLERDTVGTQAAIYGTATALLVVAYVKRKPAYLVRPFKKPSHIPEKLINERIMHTGIIRDIQQLDQDTTLLLINHRPLIPFFMRRDRVLPVKLPGVRVNGNGYSWLSNCIVGRQATFLPLAKSKRDDYVVSQLCLVHPPKGRSRLLDVSETLLKLRFAKFAQDAAAAIKRNDKYYKHLEHVEKEAVSREAWLQWAARHPWIWSKFHELKERLLPKEKLLPELVR